MATTNTSITAQDKGELSMSERFTNSVIKEFGGNVSGALSVTDYQRQLIQGYFIGIDRALKAAEDERIRKNERNTDHKYDNTLPVTWQNVNMTDLALDLVHYARMGLDMMQENMLFPIPFKNNKKNCYDINLMEGYNGKRYIAEKYAIEVPKAVTVEVVYSTDRLTPIKKSASHSIETYEFEITSPFDRGQIVGGFAYLEFAEPTKNELIIMSMKDIEKRKPKYASANFWGGKTYENGKQVDVEGWLDEMVRKTLIREAYGAKHLPRDPKKVDDNYQHMKMREAHYAEMEAQTEIAENANTVLIDTTHAELTPPHDVDAETGEVVAENATATSGKAESPNW